RLRMDRFCEFCGELRPTVYCKSDTARLCLSCDRHVHSANALSSRHLRSLLCDRCNSQQATVRCSAESLSLCENCDWNAHGSSAEASQHKRHAISGYTGCPSAAELSRMWGLDDFPHVSDSCGRSTENVSGMPTINGIDANSCCATSKMNHSLDLAAGRRNNSGNAREFDVWMDPSPSTPVATTKDRLVECTGIAKSSGTSEQQSKQKTVVVQQLLDLQKLTPQSSTQLQNLKSHFQVDSKSMIPPPSKPTAENFQARNQHQERQQSDQLQEQQHNFQEQDNPSVSLFLRETQQLKPDANIEQIMQGDTFWRSSPANDTNQLWDPHMQDLGLCDGDDNCDGFNMSDVDLTFENYEDIFGSSQDQSDSLFEDASAVCSNMERDVTLFESNGHTESAPEVSTVQGGCFLQSHISGPVVGIHPAPGTTVQGAPVPSAVGNITMDVSAPPRHSSLSLSLSGHSGESSAADYQECGISPRFQKGEPPPWYPTQPRDCIFSSQGQCNDALQGEEKGAQ
ncbi:hypothetical protein KI387_028207, partial [Taxus chinensis]